MMQSRLFALFCISSVLGHEPPKDWYAMHTATKHAVTALTEGLRRELVKQNSKIRVTVSLTLNSPIIPSNFPSLLIA
jgi:short-subunit dehydrogenase